MKLDDKPVAAKKSRIIFDTNTLISAFIFSREVSRLALKHALNRCQLVCSPETWDELAEVFQRKNIDTALPLAKRLRILAELGRHIEIAAVTSTVTDCRDSRDRTFLALALDCGASVIVTGDKDLLVLHPWRGINIITAAEFVERSI